MNREDRISQERASASARLAALATRWPSIRESLLPFFSETLLNVREDNDGGLTVYLVSSPEAQRQARRFGLLISTGYLGLSSRWSLHGGFRLVLVDRSRVVEGPLSGTVEEALGERV